MTAAGQRHGSGWGSRRTAQQYDPLGAMGSRPLAVVLGAGSVVWALLVSVFDRDVEGSPTLSALTVLLVAASAVVVLAASSPFRAPFPRWAFVAHVGLLGLASVTSVAAQWGPDRSALNDFMSLITATGIVMVAPYRPWTDLTIGGVVLAAVNAVTWGAGAAEFPHEVPVAVAAFLAAAPTLVLTAASAVFAWTFAGLAERVQIRAGSYSVARAERDGIAQSVQQDRATILSRDVAPFFAELRTRDVITDADRARARAIADGIRASMVADADRTWFEHAVRVDGGEAPVVDDPEGLIATLDTDQRAVVRTFVRAALRASTVDPAGFRARVRRADTVAAAASQAARAAPAARPAQSPAPARVSVELELAVADSDIGIHRTFDPYFAVLRVTFPDLDVAVRPSALALRFSYDQH
ncbi:hypothetical protein N8D74_00940 [Curtobacterium flaccumfaciens]|nr:hypothetical protein [Curtobacterium flaccumfaciens]MBO9040855.1 hypothetical protein [Curtobacterium flaccumfaciens pv. flaccumfaciens]MCS6562105.1 hypothetical protein [Curtobacterium flaccumfaciens pv. poinsettiae]UXN25488.1 hypothetical protein N8D74_00940 [Curtobacterium flaccumfaciens]UXN28187.1 hypothetical protein N8D75_14390 [Curtobacterium flaccumfaciens]